LCFNRPNLSILFEKSSLLKETSLPAAGKLVAGVPWGFTNQARLRNCLFFSKLITYFLIRKLAFQAIKLTQLFDFASLMLFPKKAA
jgi:hypothetical protein